MRKMVWKCLVCPGVREVLTTWQGRGGVAGERGEWRGRGRVAGGGGVAGELCGWYNNTVHTFFPTSPLSSEDLPTFGCPVLE